MAKIPELVKCAWEKRTGFPVFATTDENSQANAIYVGALNIFDDETIVIANNYFNKTLANIKSGSKGALVFITEDKKAYQIKGSIEYATSGPYFDFMNSINPEGYPGLGATVIRVETVYSGAEKLA